MTDPTPPTNVLVTRDKVQRYLSEMVRFEVTPSGGYTFRHGSTRCFVRVDALGESDTIVHIDIPVLLDVVPTDDLYRYVATQSYKFGALVVTAPDEHGKVRVVLRHVLLGTHLDAQELRVAVRLMVLMVDKMDATVQAIYGGRTFHDEPPPKDAG